MSDITEKQASDFIRTAVSEDLADGRYDRVHTRFPPEPNGYLHIGHAKAICIDFLIAEEHGGLTNIRFDDTNPVKEETEYVDAILEDIRWLGFDWGDRLYYASDYFEQLYQWAVQLIKDGKAYVDDLSQEEMREFRGTLTKPGKNSPFRDRSVAENLDLFARMRNGEFEEGERVLRAKIDMSSPNINLRDPVMYRILKQDHHRTGDKWCIYPMYDWAHGQSDSIEGITHSLCSLEYEIHRPLYDWFIEQLGIYAPRQMEFSRLNLAYTIMSKRKLVQLVNNGHVHGWDDPRMPTLAGMRRRGYTPEAIRNFISLVGVSKVNSVIDPLVLEQAVRNDLNEHTTRVMAVLDPLRVVIDNYPEGQEEYLAVPDYPQDRSRTETRQVPFSKVIYIEREDFMEEPPSKFFRLAPGREVRLMKAYYITCTDVIKDEAGNVVELRCTYDPNSRGGTTADKRKVKGTLHWVSAQHALEAEVRLYDRLFVKENPEETEAGEAFTSNVNPDSLVTLTTCKVEPSLATTQPGDRYQFMRLGFFTTDKDSQEKGLVFNRTVTLRDTWAKIQNQ
jgi:glutaminyl-tRNA synthetase